MNCEEALELLSGHLDGQNTAEEEARLQAHLESCPSCRAILQAYTQMQQGIVSLDAEPPKELHQRIMEQVRSQPAVRRSRKPIWRVGGTIAAAAVLALVLLVGGKDWFSPAGTDPAPAPALTSLASSDGMESKAVPESSDEMETAIQAKEADDAAQAPETQDAVTASENEAVEADAADAPVTAETRTPVAYAAEAPASTAENTTQPPVSEAPVVAQDENTTVTPVPNVATVTDDSGAGSPDSVTASVTLIAQLMDDPQRPAAATIVQLGQMAAEEAADGRGMQYVSDVATVRTIIADYADLYVITPPEGLEQASDTEPCAILVLTP